MKYSAWEDDDGYCFVFGTKLPPVLRQINPESKLLKIFEAESWNDAMRQYHEWQGWEPYKPMDD